MKTKISTSHFETVFRYGGGGGVGVRSCLTDAVEGSIIASS